MTNPTCKIAVSTLSHRYYISHGCMKSRTEYKTFAGAVRAAVRRGFVVENETVDPMIEYRANSKKTKIVPNLLNDRLCRIPVNTPRCCDPSSEAYWSM